MLRRIYEAYCISTFTKSMNTRQKVSGFPSLKSNLYDVAVSFDFTGSFIDPMCSAFREWYKTVVDLVSSGRTGNFVTTIPVVDSCHRWNRKRKGYRRVYEACRCGLSEEDSLTEIKGERAIETLPQTKKLLLLMSCFPVPVRIYIQRSLFQGTGFYPVLKEVPAIYCFYKK